MSSSSNAKQPRHPTDRNLRAYIEGRGSPEFHEAIEHHVQRCPPCAQLLERLRLGDASTEPDGGSPIQATMVVDAGTRKLPVPESLRDHPQFSIEAVIGRGGMGIVYLSRHRLTGRREALKILQPELAAKPDIRSRFLREIQTSARLDHANICRVYNAFEEGELLGLVMEYVPGRDLDSYVRKHGVLSVQQAAEVAMQVCRGLEHAQQKGMIHRDIKPANLMYAVVDGKASVKILDFGLTKGVQSVAQNDPQVTQQDRVLGTPHYISPEQSIDARTVDIRSDLYSLGCTLYFLLTGRPPFNGTNINEVLQAHRMTVARAVHEVNANVPVAFSSLIQTWMAKDPDQRPQTPAEAIRMLEPYVNGDPFLMEGNSPSPTDFTEWSLPEVPKATFTGAALRKRKSKQVPNHLLKIAAIFLPAICSVIAFLILQPQVTSWVRKLTQMDVGAIVLENMPDGAEVWIDDHPADFRRPTAGSPARVVAEPGSYKLSLRFQGQTLREQMVTIKAGENMTIKVDVAAVAIEQPEPPPVIPREQPPRLVPKKAPVLPRVGGEEPPDVFGPQPIQPDNAQVPAPPDLTAIFEALRARKLIEANQAIGRVQAFTRADFVNNQRLEVLSTFNRNLEWYLATVKQACNTMDAGQTLRVGDHELAFIDRTAEVVRFFDRKVTIEFKRRELPGMVELALFSSQFNEDSLEGVRIAKAIGVLTHPRLSERGVELAKGWIQDAIDAGTLPHVSMELITAFAPRPDDQAPQVAENNLKWDQMPADNRPLEVNAEHWTHKLDKQIQVDGSVEGVVVLPALFSLKGTSVLVTFPKSHRGASVRCLAWNLQNDLQSESDVLAGPIARIDCSIKGDVVAVVDRVGYDGRVRVFSGNFRTPFVSLDGISDTRTAIKVAADGKAFVAVGPDETFVRWNLTRREVVHRSGAQAPFGKKEIDTIAIRDNLESVAVANRTGSIRLWNDEGRELSKLSTIDAAHPNPVQILQFSKQGSKLTVVRANGEIELYDLVKLTLEKQIRPTLSGSIKFGTTSCARVPGRQIAMADSRKEVQIWDAATLEQTAHFFVTHDSNIASISTDGVADAIAIGFDDGVVEVWDRKKR